MVTLLTQGGTPIERKLSDLNGSVSWSVDAGDYLVNVSASGYASITDEPLSITGSSPAGDLTIDPISVTPPAAPELCSITEQLIDGSGEPAEGSVITAEPDPLPMWTDTALLGGEKREAVANPDGIVNLQLIRGKSYRIVVPLWGVDETLPVPDVANTTLKAMLESVGITSQEIPASS
jgi:hypothetical protein